jgi:penicillin G amidase
VDMSIPGNSLAMHAPGQSGVLGSEHYDDMVEPWVSGEYHPMFWERLEVEAAAAHRLTLLPRPTV